MQHSYANGLQTIISAFSNLYTTAAAAMYFHQQPVQTTDHNDILHVRQAQKYVRMLLQGLQAQVSAFESP